MSYSPASDKKRKLHVRRWKYWWWFTLAVWCAYVVAVGFQIAGK